MVCGFQVVFFVLGRCSDLVVLVLASSILLCLPFWCFLLFCCFCLRCMLVIVSVFVV